MDMAAYRSNKIKHYLHTAFWGIALAFVSGTYLTTFLSELGFSVNQIGTYNTVLQVVQLTMMVFNIFFADTIRNVKKCCALLSLAPLLTCVTLFPLCFLETFSLQPILYLIITVCVFQNLFLGFYNIICYRIPYLIIDMKDYTEVSSKAGVVSGICGISFSSLITFLASVFPFRWIMACGLVISAIFSVASCWLYHSMVIVSKEIENAPAKKPNLADLISPVFLYFYAPNLLRGLGAAFTITAVTLVCIKDITSSPAVLSALGIVGAASSILGNFLCTVIRRKLNNMQLYFFGCIFMLFLTPPMMIGKNIIIFSVFYFLANIAFNVLSVGAAVYATEVVEYSRIGMYTSIRMICMTAGQAIGAALLAAFIDKIPSVLIFLVGGVCYLISGTMYYFWAKYHPSKLPSDQ